MNIGIQRKSVLWVCYPSFRNRIVKGQKCQDVPSNGTTGISFSVLWAISHLRCLHLQDLLSVSDPWELCTLISPLAPSQVPLEAKQPNTKVRNVDWKLQLLDTLAWQTRRAKSERWGVKHLLGEGNHAIHEMHLHPKWFPDASPGFALALAYFVVHHTLQLVSQDRDFVHSAGTGVGSLTLCTNCSTLVWSPQTSNFTVTSL